MLLVVNVRTDNAVTLHP